MASKCKKGKIWPFQPWQLTFRAIQPNLSLDMWSKLGKVGFSSNIAQNNSSNP